MFFTLDILVARLSNKLKTNPPGFVLSLLDKRPTKMENTFENGKHI